MKPILLCALSLGAALVAAPAQTSTLAEAAAPYYLESNTQELRQVRQQVDAAQRLPSGANRDRFTPVYEALSEAEEALAQLRAAPPAEQAKRRAAFEEAKAKCLKVWRDFRLHPTSDAARG